MEEMALYFDSEDVNEVLSTVEKNYQEFLELSDSFLGWLLTLNDEEFDYVHRNMTHDFKNNPEDVSGLLFTQIELIHQGNPTILMSELVEDTAKKIKMVRNIKAVKESLLTYTPGATDMEWLFNITDKGSELMRLAQTLSEVEINKNWKEAE